MEDRSSDSISTSTSSLSSRKTSNFFPPPHSRQNSSPVLSSFLSAPITPLLTSSSHSTPVFNDLDFHPPDTNTSIWNTSFTRAYNKSIPDFIGEVHESPSYSYEFARGTSGSFDDRFANFTTGTGLIPVSTPLLMAEPIQTPTKPVPPTTDLARFSIGDRSVRSKSDPTDHPGAEVSTHPPTCHRSRSSSPHFTSNPQPNSSNSHPNSHPHVTVNLHPARRLRQPRLSIQKFHETFSSTFYKRNKNGYMFIRETNDDLIKIDDSTLNLTVRLGNVSREVSINTNTMKDFELVNDFKFIKRKSVSRRH